MSDNPYVEQLRGLLERPHEPKWFRHMHNLKGEWPEMWEAIMNLAYPPSGSDSNYPFGDPDASKWADEFMRLLGMGVLRFSHDTMLGWFANAIETGYMLHRDEIAPTIKKLQLDLHEAQRRLAENELSGVAPIAELDPGPVSDDLSSSIANAIEWALYGEPHITSRIVDGDQMETVNRVTDRVMETLARVQAEQADAVTQGYLDYIDNAIRNWRQIARKDPDKGEVEPDLHRAAPYYVDAFQSVRVSLFGDLLPVEEDAEGDNGE